MARIRTLKPELLEDERTAALSDSAFRLFVAAILLADDHGNLRADERWLDGQIWWARGDSRNSAESLGELSDVGLVAVYRVRGQFYMAIRGWSKHQRVDNAGRPRVPLPSDPDAEQLPHFSASLRETPLYLRPPTSEREPAANRGLALPPGPDPEPKAEPKTDQRVAEFAEAAVGEINRIASTRYKPTEQETVKNSATLVKRKFTPADAIEVVRSQREWLASDNMRKQFKPSVLLRPSNFARYKADLDARRPVAPPQGAPRANGAADEDWPDVSHLLGGQPL